MKKVIFSREHKSLVERLKKARLAAGFDQQEVARRMGKSQSFISKIEQGQRRVDVVQLKEFAKIYGRELEYFLK